MFSPENWFTWVQASIKLLMVVATNIQFANSLRYLWLVAFLFCDGEDFIFFSFRFVRVVGSPGRHVLVQAGRGGVH